MIIFPAVDIKDGKCVRLKKGRAEDSTVFAENPLDAALHWQRQGAQWLHLVDLDGAFTGKPVNLELITEFCRTLTIPIQLGGGIRNEQTAEMYLTAGVTRLIIGTLALDSPKTFQSLCTNFPGCIGASLDSDDGILKTKGWLTEASISMETALLQLAECGAAFVIHTDITRDGMQSGPNVEFLTRLSQISPLPLIAAGGIATLRDIQTLYPLTLSGKLFGVISGRAIYEGTLQLKEALTWIEQQKQEKIKYDESSNA